MNNWRVRLLPAALAIVFSVVLCSAVLLVSGANPIDTLLEMIAQVGRGMTAVNIVNTAGAYYLVAIAAAIGFQMNLLNIGIEGQYRLGACVAAIVGGAVSLPFGLHAVLVVVIGAVTGALWCGIAAVLKVYRGVSEVISTIMLNTLSIGLIAFLVATFGEMRGNTQGTVPIPASGQVPGIPLGGAGTMFGLVLLSVAVGVGYAVLVDRTRYGFQLRASGLSPTAALAGGVDSKKMIMSAMLISGAIAGVAGLPEILSRDHTFTINFPTGYGFAGLAIALLGRNHPIGIAFGALLWSFLDKSSLTLDNIGVPKEIVTILQGTIVLSVVVAYELVRRRELAAEQRRVGRALGTATEAPAAAGTGGERS
ncbi:simple sugar transport system permease protein [Saccharopolyspora antimicrobica]|uniref:Nucleoside ABC transporter membrane protein n=1 Tax=Saccharopolyspora antimicrobica TaxID=455193 RepID=A0A1I5HGZ3_9PSEU|nr:ABC transporter permease [Saccharopolyspora antimicrobica]RKT85313.1 nucleoside ABC transporter membrane protein [Saccharopolyspora antimicrobica]SFO47236.1 simple sugar transport system permease protein [Saccharopolyspora antimicrobica]